jgi:SET domain-containing protein
LSKKYRFDYQYLGELIPHNEAEKRGAIYDERNQTYLFDLTTDFAVDALRKGNKTRFINHSRTPNVAPRQLVVNGDFRIGFFAQKDIPAHTEVRQCLSSSFCKITLLKILSLLCSSAFL